MISISLLQRLAKQKVEVCAKSVGRSGQPLASLTTDERSVFEAVIYIH